MDGLTLLLFILSWLGCSAIAYGGTYAYFTNKYRMLDSPKQRRDDAKLALCMGLSGPVGFIVVLIKSRWMKYGLQFRGGPRG